MTVLVAPLLDFFCFYRNTFFDLELRRRIDPSSLHGYLISIAAVWLLRRHWVFTRTTNDQQISKYDFGFGIVASTAEIILHLFHRTDSRYFARRNRDASAVDRAAVVLGRSHRGKKPEHCCAVSDLHGAVAVFVAAADQQITSALRECNFRSNTRALRLIRASKRLHLPGHILEITQDCRGIRQITVFLEMCGGRKIHTATKLAFSIPIAVLANTLRITMTGLITWPRMGNRSVA